MLPINHLISTVYFNRIKPNKILELSSKNRNKSAAANA